MSVSTISTIAAVIIFALLLFFVIKGWRKGFLRILFSTFSIIVTIVISALLMEPCARWLQNETFVGHFVQERVAGYVEDKTKDLLGKISPEIESYTTGLNVSDNSNVSNSENNTTEISSTPDVPYTADISASEGDAAAIAENSDILTEHDINDFPGIQNSFIDSLLLPGFVKTLLKGENTLEEYARMQVSGFQEYITLQITTIIVRIIALLLLMIVVYILLRILLHLIRFIDKIPIIHGFNRLLGALLGLAEALLIIWLICLLLSVFAGSQAGSEVLQVIQASKFLTFIYENNLISMAVKAIFTSAA